MAVEDLALDGCPQRTQQQNDILVERSDLNRAFDFSSKRLILYLLSRKPNGR
jgi:hypothetical protein